MHSRYEQEKEFTIFEKIMEENPEWVDDYSYGGSDSDNIDNEGIEDEEDDEWEDEGDDLSEDEDDGSEDEDDEELEDGVVNNNEDDNDNDNGLEGNGVGLLAVM
jgi:hypothetical protein